MEPDRNPKPEGATRVKSRIQSLVLSCALLLGLAIAAPVSAATTTSGQITGADTTDSCFAGTDGTCSGDGFAGPTGVFNARADLNSPDSPLTRGNRYSQSLVRYTIGFDLPAPTRQADIKVSLRLARAEAMWTQDGPEVFGGAKNAASGAKVLFQLLGHSAPSNCGCGWFIQSAKDVVVSRVDAPDFQRIYSNWPVELTMSATNPYGDKLLPAGHYEVLLRGYALTELLGPGDWGTLTASVMGEIKDVTVSIPAEASTMTIEASGNGSNRVLTATLTAVDSNAPIDGRTISFYGDGLLLGTAVTDNGVATLPLEGKFRGGSHLFRAEFGGDDSYTASAAETNT